MFEWCVVMCGYKNIHQNDMCLKEIGLHVQSFLIIVGSLLHIKENLYNQKISLRI